jgi:hypothetical protein
LLAIFRFAVKYFLAVGNSLAVLTGALPDRILHARLSAFHHFLKYVATFCPDPDRTILPVSNRVICNFFILRVFIRLDFFYF